MSVKLTAALRSAMRFKPPTLMDKELLEKIAEKLTNQDIKIETVEESTIVFKFKDDSNLACRLYRHPSGDYSAFFLLEDYAQLLRESAIQLSTFFLLNVLKRSKDSEWEFSNEDIVSLNQAILLGNYAIYPQDDYREGKFVYAWILEIKRPQGGLMLFDLVFDDKVRPEFPRQREPILVNPRSCAENSLSL